MIDKYYPQAIGTYKNSKYLSIPEKWIYTKTNKIYIK
jgi:hypothetical protein